jgi:diguanylate cyclase
MRGHPVGSVTNYLDVPALVAFSFMAVVLLRRREGGHVRLWVAGLALIGLEGFARMVYLGKTTPALHAVAHAVALDAYFLAGVAFLQSASGRFVRRERASLYMIFCAVPYLLLLSCYGAGVKSTPLYVTLAAVGLCFSMVVTLLMKRPGVRLGIHLAMWVPVLISAAMGDPRQAAYTALFTIFALAAVAFLRGLPGSLQGRVVVVVGFFTWSLCFLVHPTIARFHPEWAPLLNKVWDLEKFVVMFGLLLVSLEEHGAKSEYLALHDELTGLPNRRLFEDRLSRALARARRDGSRVLLCNMDLNGFKRVNDTLGHDCGDDMLREVAARIQSMTRETDTLARMGGDEFQAIVSGMAGGDEVADLRRNCQLLVEKFQAAVEQPMHLRSMDHRDTVLEPSLSVGYAIFPDDADSVEALCQLADLRMYEDKRRSRPVEAMKLASVAGY